MNPIVKAIFFAGVAYDETGCLKKISSKFKITDIALRTTQTDFFVTFIENGILNILVRGTDGTDFKKWLAAWKRNFDMHTNEHGLPDGFRRSAESLLNLIKTPHGVHQVQLFGHSAGASIIQIAGAQLARDLGLQCVCYAVAGAPAGNEIWLHETYEPLHDQGLLMINRIENPRDGVTKWFNGKGVQVGACTVLPPDNPLQRIFKKINGVIEHSPREYCDGIKTMLPRDPDISWVRRQMVN